MASWLDQALSGGAAGQKAGKARDFKKPKKPKTEFDLGRTTRSPKGDVVESNSSYLNQSLGQQASDQKLIDQERARQYKLMTDAQKRQYDSQQEVGSEVRIGRTNKYGQMINPGPGNQMSGDPRTPHQQNMDYLIAAKRHQRKDEGGKEKQMTWDQYNALSKEAKAAIDYNTLLNKANAKDTQLARSLGNHDDVLTIGELLNADSVIGHGYRNVYRKSFGTDPNLEDKNMIYAPNTVAMLNKLKVRYSDNPATLEEYRNGSGYINQEDIKRSRWRDADPYNDRARWVGSIVSKIRNAEKELVAAKAVFNGANVKVDLRKASRSQYGQLVDQAARELSKYATPTDEENYERLNIVGAGKNHGEGGLDLSSLTSNSQQGQVKRAATFYDLWRQDIESKGEDLKMLENPKDVKYAAGRNDINAQYLLDIGRSRKKKATKMSEEELRRILAGG